MKGQSRSLEEAWQSPEASEMDRYRNPAQGGRYRCVGHRKQEQRTQAHQGRILRRPPVRYSR